MRSRSLAAVAAWTTTAVLVAALMTGCSDEEPGGAEGPDPSPSASSTGPTGSEGSPSAATESPSGPVAEPADGEEVTMLSGISFHLTKGADWLSSGSDSTAVVADAQVEGVSRAVLLEAGELTAQTDDLDVAAQASIDSRPDAEKSYPTLRREEDREVNGVTGYVLRSENDETRFYEFGVLHAGTSFRINLEVPLEMELEDWVEPILASIEWP